MDYHTVIGSTPYRATELTKLVSPNLYSYNNKNAKTDIGILSKATILAEAFSAELLDGFSLEKIAIWSHETL
jgi:hypothetical protein